MNCPWRSCFRLFLGLLLIPLAASASTNLWNTGYYPGYRQNAMPASVVDFSALTHIIHFALLPNPAGELNASTNGITPARTLDVVTKAHAAGKKVLISVGGGGSNFGGATSSANLGTFTTNIVNFMRTNGYDGVDIDWEPIKEWETNQFATFITALRAQLDTITPRPMLTAAVYWEPEIFATLQNKFDQINIMTYGMSGTYPGWVTWHSAPLFNGGYRFPSTGGLVPSTEKIVDTFINAGVAPGKLGIGIAFFGQLWIGGEGTSTGGASQPRQSWTNPPETDATGFNTIMASYYSTNRYRWDTNAHAAYLSIDNPGSTNDMFISYDDERTCQSKVSFARNRRLGGVMIWELGQGYRASEPIGKRDSLLQAIKSALTATPHITAISRSNQNIQVNFQSVPLGQYRVLTKTNLTSPTWSTLTTNLVGQGNSLQYTHTNGLSGPQRFYRIQTPP